MKSFLVREKGEVGIQLLPATGNGGGPASLDFAAWTDACALPIDRNQSIDIFKSRQITELSSSSSLRLTPLEGYKKMS